MGPVRNPYSPGAGTRPPALVGREREIDAMDVALQRLLLGRDGRSEMLTGLRGVGKTVLLNEFEALAGGRGYFHEHIEVNEHGDLPVRLASAFRRVLLAMDARRRIGERARRSLGILKAFSLRLPGGPEMSIDVDAVYGPADSGDLATDLAGLFVELGEVAADHATGVLVTIDELHYVSSATLEALVMGLHRASQLRLPITIAAASLPNLAALADEAKSYAERMFVFPAVGSLDADQAREALVVPATDEGVHWSDDALRRVGELTMGFPYFLQEFGKQAWDNADGPEAITLDDVERSVPGGHGRARRQFLPCPHRPHHQPRAGLPARHGRAGPGTGPLGRGGRPARQEGNGPRSHPGRPDQKGPVLLTALGRDRLHRAPVRRLYEAVLPRLDFDCRRHRLLISFDSSRTIDIKALCGRAGRTAGFTELVQAAVRLEQRRCPPV